MPGNRKGITAMWAPHPGHPPPMELSHGKLSVGLLLLIFEPIDFEVRVPLRIALVDGPLARADDLPRLGVGDLHKQRMGVGL